MDIPWVRKLFSFSCLSAIASDGRFVCEIEVVERTADSAIAIQEGQFRLYATSSPPSRLHYRREIKFRIPPRYASPYVRGGGLHRYPLAQVSAWDLRELQLRCVVNDSEVLSHSIW